MNQQQTIHIKPEDWQKVLLIAQAEAIADQTNLFTWADSRQTEPTLTGPKTITISLAHSWTTQEGLEELGKHEFIDFEQVMDWVNVPIYEHPVLYKARMTMQRNRAVVRRMRNAAH